MKKGPTDTRQSLRQRAEEKARIDGVKVLKSLSFAEARKLLHELQVHQIELEMQNEELRLKQDELDAAHLQVALASVVENSDNIIVCKDLGLRVVATNMAFVQASGHASIAEMIGKTDAEIFNVSPDTEPVYSYMEDERRAQLLPQGGFILREEPVLLPNGEIQYVQIKKYPIYTADGRLIGTGSISIDITERKRLEEALQSSNNRLHQLVVEKTSQLADAFTCLASSEHFKQAIIDSLPVNIAVLDLNGVITAINKPWLYFGYGNDIADETSISVGTDYLALCRISPSLEDSDSETAYSALQGITAVLEGRETSFVMDYPCHSPVEKRWYQMSVNRPEAEFEGAIISHVDITSLKLLEEERRSYTVHMVEVIEQERFRTARELHDDLGQRLTLLSFAISQLKQNHQGRKETSQIHLDMQTGVDAMMESLRRICTALRPALLDELGLSAALEWLCKDFSRRTGLPCGTDVKGNCCPYNNSECCMTIFRIVQESLSNTIKHAGASRVDVSLSRNDSAVFVEINDDGRGILPKKGSGDRSFGIIGMRERAHAIGAGFEIISNKGKGTSVKLVIPCRSQESTDAVSYC
jgi:PAS domain S-box-containing protein